MAKGYVNEVEYRDEAPTGKLDLVVDLNFRMDTSALYSDMVLPAATWYEKTDLNSTDLHTFVNPMQAAVPPCLGIQERLGHLQSGCKAGQRAG
jgi:nitrate reductase / nitrite oxidoreductase, alpha subunit